MQSDFNPAVSGEWGADRSSPLRSRTLSIDGGHAREIEPHCREAKGVYIFKGTDSEYWKKILDLKNQYGFRILWELNGDYACPQYMDAVRGIAEGIDVFSN